MELQQTAFLVIDVDVGEAVLECCGKDFSGVDEFVNTPGVLGFDKFLEQLRLFSVEDG